MTRRIIITGGGTGGHVYPALSVAEKIRADYPGIEILYIGTKGLESRVIPEHGFRFEMIDSAGLRRQTITRTITGIFRAGMGAARSIRIFKTFKPDAVFGTGGYVAGPVLLAAFLTGVPYFLHEQNVRPGFVTRLFSSGAAKVMVSFEATKKYLRKGDIKVTGLPVRAEALERKKDESLGLEKEKNTLLVLGGSQGSRCLNSAVLSALDRIAGPDRQMLWLTGPNDYKELSKTTSAKMKIVLKPYLDNIGAAYTAADLAVCRSGAGTLSELAIFGIPAILVPFAAAAYNHQMENAHEIAKTGAARVLEEKNLDRLAEEINDLLSKPDSRKKMSQTFLKLARPDAARDIAGEIVNV